MEEDGCGNGLRGVMPHSGPDCYSPLHSIRRSTRTLAWTAGSAFPGGRDWGLNLTYSHSRGLHNDRKAKNAPKESNKTISSGVTGTFSNGLTWTEIHSYNQKTRPYCPYSFFTQESTFFSPSSKGKLSLSFSSVFEKQLITGEECITQPLYSHFGIPLGIEERKHLHS